MNPFITSPFIVLENDWPTSTMSFIQDPEDLNLNEVRLIFKLRQKVF